MFPCYSIYLVGGYHAAYYTIMHEHQLSNNWTMQPTRFPAGSQTPVVDASALPIELVSRRLALSRTLRPLQSPTEKNKAWCGAPQKTKHGVEPHGHLRLFF